MFTDPAEVQHAIRGLKISKAPGIPNRALKHLPQRVILLLVALLNAILNSVFSSSTEARSSHLHSETGEGTGTTLFLSAHKSSRHDWQGF
jgi:hypothetical protein